jgi:hypothetical protein
MESIKLKIQFILLFNILKVAYFMIKLKKDIALQHNKF